MLINRVQELVREHYVFPEVATQVAAVLDDVSTDVTSDGTDEQVALTLTTALQSVNGDLHLRVKHFPDGVPPAVDEEAVRAHFAATSRTEGPGITEVRRLAGNVGLIAIGPVIPPPEYTGPAAAAAFTLLDGVSRLVLDLRGCVGGVPDSVALVVSHLLGAEPVHLQDFVHRDGTIESTHSSPGVTPRLPDVPVVALTSARTFSGGEELAYDLQALGRGVVVGETTGGGAHPRAAFDLTEHLQLHVPVARAVNAVTGTNWEGVGVVPDHPALRRTRWRSRSGSDLPVNGEVGTMGRMARILMIVTAADSLTLADGTAHPTGFWAEELVVAHRTLSSAGHEVVVATPGGRPAPVDQGSLDATAVGDEDKVRELAAYLDSIEEVLAHPVDLSELDTATFDAVVLPGGHGPMADLATDPVVGAMLVAADDAGRVIAPFCHGPAALLSATRADGGFAFAGRRLTVFTNEEENSGGLGDKSPWFVADVLADRGAVVESAAPWSSHVVVDGNLVSGQNPQSSDEVAATVLKLLAD